MSEHTKEPWIVAEESFDNDGIQESVIRALGGRAVIAVTIEFGENNPNMREANARRIVACVNACAGVTDEQFDGGWTAQGISKYAVSLEQQRDELLAIAEELAESAAYWSEYCVPLGIVDRLNAAIAKAKEGAA